MNRFRRILSVWWVILVVGCAATVAGPRRDLLNAAYRGDATAVHALLAKGADVNAKGYYGETALIAASEYGPLEVVQALLDQRADVNAKTRDGRIASDLAIKAGYADIGALLMRAGAKP